MRTIVSHSERLPILYFSEGAADIVLPANLEGYLMLKKNNAGWHLGDVPADYEPWQVTWKSGLSPKSQVDWLAVGPLRSAGPYHGSREFKIVLRKRTLLVMFLSTRYDLPPLSSCCV